MQRSRVILYSVFLIFATLCLQSVENRQVHASENPPINIYSRTNVREECRQLLAGNYLNIYDQVEKLAQGMARSKQRVADLKTERDKTKKDLKRIEQALQKDPLHHDNSREKMRLQAYLKQIEQLEKGYAKEHDTLKEKHAAAQQREQLEKRELERVFSFKRVADKAGGGYPINIQYKSTCPKYRHVCALPKADRDNLATLRTANGLPEACKRYISLSFAP